MKKSGKLGTGFFLFVFVFLDKKESLLLINLRDSITEAFLTLAKIPFYFWT